jgi:hypothetical protein
MKERYPNSAAILKIEDASGSPTRGILTPAVLEHLKKYLREKKSKVPVFEKLAKNIT